MAESPARTAPLPPEEKRQASDVLVDWFLEQYHLDFLSDALNAGATEVPAWQPHMGHRAQAAADAEKVLSALLAEGFVVMSAARGDRGAL